jgi:hypothetical protein
MLEEIIRVFFGDLPQHVIETAADGKSHAIFEAVENEAIIFYIFKIGLDSVKIGMNVRMRAKTVISFQANAQRFA